jgi:putative membrane protein
MMTGYEMGFGFYGWVFMAIFWLVLIALAIWLVRSIIQGNHSAVSNSSATLTAREILDQRYSRGEITREQYVQMKQDIQ